MESKRVHEPAWKTLCDLRTHSFQCTLIINIVSSDVYLIYSLVCLFGACVCVTHVHVVLVRKSLLLLLLLIITGHAL